jgi:protein required for attachment to host cells
MMSSAESLGQKSDWVVVADESRAIFYAWDKKYSPLRELAQLENEVARQKTSSQISDRGGRSFDSPGQGRHTMTNEKTDPKQHAAIVFAKEIAGRVAVGRQEGSCRDYALVAAPRFLGLLRDAFETAGHSDPLLTIDKGVVGQDPAVIEKLLNEK